MNSAEVLIKFKGDTSDVDRKAESVKGNVSSKMGQIAGNIGKAFLKGTAVATGAMAAMVVKGVKEYAKLEQSIGGVETLFKKSSKTVIANAEKAYKTAGVDANTYMEQVTSFSASLLQAVGGDTEKAANTADMAIRDMADNANKMGTSMEMIQNAYQGFAKQNYMMLDNLKLGYGGTKTEMQRLLADAQKITGIKYDINNLDDVYKAIHVIQGELGITGTTAKEAASTIQGSAASMKAAFTNFLSGAGGINEVISTVKIFGNNVMKAIVKLAPQIVQGLVELVNGLIPQLSGLIDGLLPVVVNGAISLVQGIASALPALIQVLAGMLPTIISSLMQGITQIVNSIAQQIPTIIPVLVQAIIDGLLSILDNIDLMIDAGINLIMGLIDGIMEAIPILIERLPEIIEKMIPKLMTAAVKLKMLGPVIIIKLITGIIKAIPKLIASIPKIIKAIIDGLREGIGEVANVGKEMISGFLDNFGGLKDALQPIIEPIKNLIDNTLKPAFDGLKTAFQNVMTALQPVINFIKTVVILAIQELIKIIQFLWQILSPIISLIINILGVLIQVVISIISNIINTISGIVNFIAEVVSKIVNFIKEIVNKVYEHFRPVIDFIKGFVDKIKSFFSNLKTGIGNAVNGVVNFIKSIPSKIASIPGKIVNFFKSLPGKMLSIGGDIVKGIGKGITSGITWLKNKIKEFVGNVTDFIKKVFKIGSPSKLMADEVGQWLPKGIAVGITANTDAITKSIGTMQDDITSAFAINPELANSSSLHYSPNVVVNNQMNMTTDPLGQVVGNIKTFANGSKNDYNYGMGA